LKQGSEARKSQKAYTTLAENEDWLAKNDDKLVQKADHEGDSHAKPRNNENV
jgi:hypothetical protein